MKTEIQIEGEDEEERESALRGEGDQREAAGRGEGVREYETSDREAIVF